MVFKMISVIICSRKYSISDQLFQNIEKTVGSFYELVIVDNSENKYSIFEAYNLGIEQSKGEYWCFVHDDVVFHTRDWGQVINRIFESDPKIGLIGVAGAKIKTKMPSAWWDCPEEEKVINIIQHLPLGKIEHWEVGFSESPYQVVVAIDGVFMVARRDERIRFSNSLRGFHNYDLNLSFEYLKHNYKIIATNKICIEHFSIGIIDSSWYHSAAKLHSIYSRDLPLSNSNMLQKDIRTLEFNNGFNYIMNSKWNLDKLTILKYWFRLFLLQPSSKSHLKFFKMLVR